MGVLISLHFYCSVQYPGQQIKKDTPLETLKKRFASEEMDKEEHLIKKNK